MTTLPSPAKPPAESQQVTQTSSTWPDVSLVGVAMIWGINIPMMKNGLDQVDPFVFNAIRLVISASVLCAFALKERRNGILPKSGLPMRRVVIYGFMVSGIYQLMFLSGMARTTSGNTALIIATIPMWTALIARIFLAEKLLKLAWLGLSIALVGTIIVALQKNDISADRQHLIGNLFVLGAALTWSVGTVYSRPLLKLISPMQLSGFGVLISLPIHLIFAMGRYSDSLESLQSVNVWLVIFYAGVLSSGLALPMWNFGVRHAGAAHASVIQNLIPLIAIIAAWFARGETVTSGQLLGGSLIIGGLVTMRAARRSVDSDHSTTKT